MRSILGPTACLFAAAIVVFFVLDAWAWQARQADVSGWWLLRRERIFKAHLYTEEGNRRRRIAVAWFIFTVALAVVMWVAMLFRMRDPREGQVRAGVERALSR